ncbi:MAG: DegT/DnrJ/EryC1/StrS family aminotransferase [Nitrospirae bacterium]|nr:MAG: DegT/DnrJ/EryC1/StrS family aminotransferase [Nitrospirota bacterium]
MKAVPMLDLQAEYEYMKGDIDAAILRCLTHQKWILGPEVDELENKIAKYIGVQHAVGTSSGTEALVLALRALSIKLKGQDFFDKTAEIITTPFTFTATGDAILRAGAKPVFVDIDPATYNIDASKINEYLKTNHSNVVGIVPVHLYGQSCNMDAIQEIAQEYNLFVVEDAAQAFGGMWKGKKLGSIGTLGAFSFFPSKNLGGFGDAGMVSTDDEELASIVRMLIKHGGKDKYNVDYIGYNARLDTFQAAVIDAKFRYLDEFNEKRRVIAGLYASGLKGLKGISLPETLSDVYHVYNQYTIGVTEGKRDELQGYLSENGIASMVYYPFPLHKMKVFKSGRSKVYDELVHAEQAAQMVLNLPIGPLQQREVTDYVIESVKGSCRKNGY